MIVPSCVVEPGEPVTTKGLNAFSFVFILLFVSCSNISLKKKVSNKELLRLGVIGFKITAPVKLKDIDTDPDEKKLEDVISFRESQAKEFFFQYFRSYYKDIELVNIPRSSVAWKKDFKISKDDLKQLQIEHQVDAILVGEIPWYGKTDPLWPWIGFTTDIAIETLIIGLVTDWNPTIIWANVGLEIITNGPLWFGGAYLFGRAYKPVTIETKLFTFRDGFKEYESDFEVTKSQHMLEKFPKKERKKIENQLDSSLKKALKGIAIEINEK